MSALTTTLISSCSATDPDTPPEIGTLEWKTDYPKALAESKKSSKPIFALFQEVPGWAGCQQFGQTVLTHPLLVDTVESTFTPILIRNNVAGKDAELLKKFNEPAWNYQVVRFLDSSEKDIIPRKDKIWTIDKLTERIQQTLTKQEIKAPNSLELLKLETETSKHKTIALAMHCFWTGERKLGAIEGVILTEAGWLDNNEVTLVTYHTDKITLSDLLDKAAAIDCAHKVYLSTANERKTAEALKRFSIGKLDNSYKKAKINDQKKQLSDTKYAKLNLSPIQSTKINAFARTDIKKANSYLTKKQLAEVSE